MKNKKIWTISIILMVIFIGVFTFNINMKDKERTPKKTLFAIPVSYSIIDSSTPNDASISNYMEKYSDKFINFISSVAIEVEENGEYFTGKLSNIKINQNIADYVFSFNNIRGEVIDDCKFDEKTKTISIPKKYYEGTIKEKKSPIQMQILSKVNKNDIKNTNINVKINNKEKKVSNDGNDTATIFSIAKYGDGKNISKDDLTIYINNSKIKLDERLYEYEPSSSTVFIGMMPLTIENIDIYIEKKGIFNVLFKKANAAGLSTKELNTAYKLKEEPDKTAWAKNKEYLLTDVVFAYNTGKEWYGDENCIKAYKNGKVASNDKLYYLDKDKNIQNVKSNALVNFVADLNSISSTCEYSSSSNESSELIKIGECLDVDKILKFPSNAYIPLYCMEHDQAFAGVVNEDAAFKVKVLARSDTKNYIVLFLYASNGTFTQIPGGIIKLSWNEEPKEGKITIKKRLYSNGIMLDTKNSEEFKFTLYDEHNCQSGEKISTKSLDEYSNVQWKNLSYGNYSIKEEKCDSDKYVCDDYCRNVVLNVESLEIKVDNTDKNYKPIDNYEKYWCADVTKKTNSPDLPGDIGNIKFYAYSDSNCETQIGGPYTTSASKSSRLIFGPFSTDTIYYKEVGDGNSTHWNDDKGCKQATAYAATIDKNNKGAASCPSNTSADEKINTHKKWCIKATKKDKSTNQIITSQATFRLCSDSQCNSELARATTINGVATFMGLTHDGTSNTGGTPYYVQEISAPAGYTISDTSPKQAPAATLLSKDKTNSTNPSDCSADPNAFSFEDSKYLLNWYKVTEDLNTRTNGAEFNVKDDKTGNYIIVSGTETQTDDKGVQKTCYKYSGEGELSKASTMTSMNTNTNGTTTNGEVCISGLENQGSYTITETKPVEYHTFDSKKQISLTSKTSFTEMNDDNKFINLPTEFEFTKTVSSGDGNEKIIVNGAEKTLSELTTEELRQIEFNVYDSNGNILSFVQISEGLYDYVGNTIDPSNGTPVTALYLNNERKIRIKHLPWGATFSIKEKESKVCNSASDYDKCIGYYYPDYSKDSNHQFTITSTYNSISTQNLVNKPTEIKFTKKDFYGYYDESDIVDFENDKERSDFDRIVFKLKDANGKYLTLKKIADHGTCQTDDSYSEYRYVYSDNSDTNGTELHTCGGHIRITNLCRGQKYTIEEISVPDDSVFVKESTTSTPTEAEYTIPCTDGDGTATSTTKLISDKPTRVRFEKRDSKYNYLIPDETTTFKMYKCAKGQNDCHPADYKTDEEREKNGMELVKFHPRAVISKDEEDPTDMTGLAGVEVYKAMSDSDVKKGTKYVTELHPYHGILVFRYLQSGYTYKLLETVAPKNYTLPEGRNAETKFTVVNDTVSVDEIDVPNKPTSLLIRKYTDDGKLLAGAQFKVHERKSCDPNLTAKAQISDGNSKLMKLKTVRDGVYESREVVDTDTITTCTDTDVSKCSDISTNAVTKLTYTDYLGSWADFDSESTKTKDGTKIELQEGEALIQYLEYGHCYIIEETKAPKGYSLPENDEDRFTMITIENNDMYAHDTYKTLINKPTPFTFYKYDEFNKLIDGAEFKLQKLDVNKKYHDITVTKEEKDGKLYYKVDNSTDNTVITTLNGSATVYYLEPGQYRIVETKPAPGKELTKNPNIATFFVDESGNVYGNSIIVNKSKTERIEVKNSASAELIVNIQTGQTVIKYGLIITIILALITGLMIIKKKMNKR